MTDLPKNELAPEGKIMHHDKPMATAEVVSALNSKEQAITVVPPSDGFKSRKFLVANGSAFATMAYAMVGQALGWIKAPTLEYLLTAGLIAVGTYCGFNIAEKIGLASKTRGTFACVTACRFRHGGMGRPI